MLRALTIWVAIVALVAAGCVASAQGEETGSAVAAATLIVTGDPLWQPGESELSRWVSDGITAASAEMDLLAIPVVARMTWSSAEGVELEGERSFRFVALMTPELTAHVVGYAAAWQEDTWSRILEDEAKVSAKLAAGLKKSLSGGTLYFPIAIRGPEYAKMLGAVYYDGQWRAVQLAPWAALTDFTSESLGEAKTDPMWAAEYLMSTEARQPALSPANEMRVYVCTWARDSRTRPDADFVSELPTPDWTGRGMARLAVGSAELFAWVDVALTP